MTIEQILQELERNEGTFPREAVEAAIARRSEIVPELLRILEYTRDNAERLADDPSYVAHIYALMLLAQFREPQAYPLVVRLFSLPGEVSVELTDDVVTEDLASILASVALGDLSGMRALVENQAASEWVRSAALDGMVAAAAWGEAPREDVIGYFAALFGGRLERTASHVWNELVCCCVDLHATELFDQIKQAYAEGLVDPDFVGLEEVRQAFARDTSEALAALAEHPQYAPITDVISAMEGWAWFDEEAEAWDSDQQPEADEEPEPEEALKPLPASRPMESDWWPEPIRRTQPKIGRNDPCPCGSGKKYKKCCGA